jgi:hypothetical protein
MILQVIRGGVPQGSKVGPINNLPAVIRDEMSQITATSSEACAIIEDDTITGLPGLRACSEPNTV